jgi:hypothetical protein
MKRRRVGEEKYSEDSTDGFHEIDANVVGDHDADFCRPTMSSPD